MEQILPFAITNEMAVAIGLLGPYALKRCEPKLERLFSSVQSIALFRGLSAWKRERKYKRLKEIRRNRNIYPIVQDEIARCHTYFIMFSISILFYVYLLMDSPIKELFNINVWFTVCLAFPVYYFEIRWLLAATKKNELLRAMRRKRVWQGI
ncbi:hypothetical protein [Vibrio splendidus]|uniref:hypothetical protein n=1 Tax=Vibrio splendidus TaxID=29497 RepID=UPI0003800DD8|nr:hypothetical protein [Vibrio splendidus]OED74404.1 hypothetical protein A144_08515 [Vibrio splendidus ZF-90]OEF20790.1 hypothetical protein A145_03545 [Vibrio splendidus 5S-101]PMI29011.1 hypothetical protein BCU48_14575 [Vibrio splendidus]PMM97138.1 hypothetical protein BCT41_15260 [Vibrio splendidus]PTP36892.1 hypothetical protein CWN95_05150 [Vibrio splendidus]